MSGTQAIKMLESRAREWYYVSPETHQELAAMLREAKEIMERLSDGYTGGTELSQRAEKWLKE